MEIAAALPPGITTIDVAARDIGRRAAAAVLSRLRGDPAGPPRQDLGFAVVARGSTRQVGARYRAGPRKPLRDF
jgi:DNA-binding LacI/PurR family transcriptional regulator